MSLYLYMHNKYTQYNIHILCKQKLLFWMRLISINHLTALLYTHYKNNILLKGSYDAISSFAFSLECYKLLVHR